MQAIMHRPRRTGRLFASAAALALCPPAHAAPPARDPPGPALSPTAAERCPAPADWRIAADPAARFHPISNSLTLDRDGVIYWNNAQIDLERLQSYLDIVALMRPAPQLLVEVDPAAPCEQAKRIVAIAAGALDCTRLCSHAIIPWRSRPIVAPPAPSPPPDFRPVPSTPSQFRPLPAPSAPPPSFRPVPAAPAVRNKDSNSGSPK